MASSAGGIQARGEGLGFEGPECLNWSGSGRASWMGWRVMGLVFIHHSIILI